MTKSWSRLAVLASLTAGVLVTTGCKSSDDDESPATPTRHGTAVIANYMHQTLSFVDFDKLVSGPHAGDDARLGEMDLSQYSQAPYGIKVTPDGRTAVVTQSQGFFLVPGASALLLGQAKGP